MGTKNTIKVMIDGKIITLAGFEEEEYLTSIANYINTKIAEVKEIPGYNRMSPELKGRMVEINIADDYFKAKKRVAISDRVSEDKEKETYDLKQDLVAAKMEIERLKKELGNLTR